jgi:hypothetical protein
MELYLLDNDYRRKDVVDVYESLVWTDRWQSFGDFELDVVSNHKHRSIFKTGTFLFMNKSFHIMRVESVEDELDDSGRVILKVRGRSLETFLMDRIAVEYLPDDTEAPPEQWVIQGGTALSVAYSMYSHVCIQGNLHSRDIFPNVSSFNNNHPAGVPSNLIPHPITDLKWVQKIDTLYNAIRAVCTSYDLTFKFYRRTNYTEGFLFGITRGSDRTSKQSVVKPIIFATNMDNINSTRYFRSIQDRKNVAYTFASDYGSRRVNDASTSEGWKRHVMALTGVTIDEIDTWERTKEFWAIGQQELKRHRMVSIFDAEVSHNTDYQYDVDYILGDRVELRDQDGSSTEKRVSEYTFVSDRTGQYGFPTLSDEGPTIQPA